MEIREYIREYRRTKRRWLRLLVVVPIVAGLAAAAMLSIQPKKSMAIVNVRVPSSVAVGDSQIGLYIARLTEGLSLPSVRRQIVAETKVPRSELSSLGVERQRQSDQFIIMLTTTTGDDRTLAAALATAKIGTVWVAQRDTGRIDTALKVAQSAYDQAQGALFAYQDEIGDLDPVGTYSTISRSLIAPSPNVSVGALREQQATLVAQVRRYTQLRDAVNSANARLGAARADKAEQQAQVATTESGELILDSRIAQRSTVQPIIEGAVLAAAVAFILVVGLSLLPDLFRRQRARTSAADEGIAPEDAAEALAGPATETTVETAAETTEGTTKTAGESAPAAMAAEPHSQETAGSEVPSKPSPVPRNAQNQFPQARMTPVKSSDEPSKDQDTAHIPSTVGSGS